MEPKPEYICNVGVAFHKIGNELPRAQLYLSLCVDTGKNMLDKAFLDAASAVLTSVEEQLAREPFTPVRVNVVPPTTIVTVDAFGGETFVGSRLIWLPRGKHKLALAAEGYTGKTIEVDAAGADRVTVGETLARTVVVEPPPKPPKERRTRVARSKLPPLVSTALTGLAVGVAAFSFSKANSVAKEAQFALTQDVFARDRDRVDSWNSLTVGAVTIAILGAGLSGYLWYRALGAPKYRVEVGVGGGGAGAFVGGRF
jgi:hypothetical protein